MNSAKMSPYEQYLDQLSSGRLKQKDAQLLQELNEDELREISFTHTLKSTAKTSEPEKEFIHSLQKKMNEGFEVLYGQESLSELTRSRDLFLSRKSFWSFLYPVGVMILLVGITSLGFLNYGKWKMATRDNTFTPSSSPVETREEKSPPDESFLALNSDIEELDNFLMQEDDELGALENDLFVFSSSFDEDFIVLEAELNIMLDSLPL